HAVCVFIGRCGPCAGYSDEGAPRDEAARLSSATSTGRGVRPLTVQKRPKSQCKHARGIAHVVQRLQRLFWSERRDLNPGPPVPQSAILVNLFHSGAFWNNQQG